MSFTSAPPQMQPWVRATDDHLTQIDQSIYDISNQLSLMGVPDKTAYVAGPAINWAAAVGTNSPANASVQFVNTTGLIQVTISAMLAATLNGSVGASFYIDGAPVAVTNNLFPTNGVQFRDTTNTAAGSGTGLSYTTCMPIRKGLHTVGIFYFVNNTGSATSQVLSSSLIVKGV